MVTKQKQVRKIWHRCFDDSPEYEEMYFSEIYRDDDALTLEHEGQAVASLMLQPYSMHFHATDHAPTGYISGAATLPQWRNRGFMTTLMEHALTASRERGYIFTTLIPADRTLELYYRRFDFSPVFRADRQRYTSLHTFRRSDRLLTYDGFDSVGAFEFFQARMASRPCAILHDRRQYDCIVKDNSADGGSMAGVCDHDGNICGMAFVVPRNGTAVVTDLLHLDHDARETTLAEVRRQYPGQQIEVIAPPDPQRPHHSPRGMLRIIDADTACRVIAETHIGLNFNFRLHDRLLPANNGIYHIANGEVTRLEWNKSNPGTTLDLDPSQLAAIIFGNKTTADIFNFPSTQPFMSLMLD